MKRLITTIILLILNFNIYAQKKPFTLETQFSLEYPTDAIISPDGNNIVYIIRKADFEKSSWNTQIYLLNVESKKTRKLTNNSASSTSPQWSPDSKSISFLSKREYFDKTSNEIKKGITQLWAIPIDGGEAFILVNLPNDVEEYSWSPDGKKIVLLSAIEESPEEIKLKADREKTKNDEVIYPKNNPQKNIWIYDLITKQLTKIFTGDPGITGISFSSNSEKLIYQTNYTGEYNDEQKFDLWTLTLDGKTEQLTNFEGPETLGKFSPDGNFVSYISQTVPDIEFAETDIHIINLKTKENLNLTKNFNLSVNDYFWNPNSQTIYAQVNEGIQNSLYEFNLKKKKFQKITKNNTVISNISSNLKGDKICLIFETNQNLKEIGLVRDNSFEILTNFSKELDDYSISPPQVMKFQSFDKKYEIEVLTVLPINFDSTKKYPLILCIHGGPYSSFKQTLIQSYPMQAYANEGYIVIAPNIRGSSGYNDEFGQANRYDLGGGDYLDAMSAVDFIISKGIVDTTKMGVIGGSYGGFMTNWIISQTNRFSAAVSMYGIFNFFTDFSNSWQPIFEKMYFGYYYWERPIDRDNLFINRSPAFYVTNITTPVLILQGDKDVYTNIANSQEMYQALITLGRDVQYVVYPREGHGIRNEPQHYLNMHTRGLGWFNKYLK